MTDIISIAKPSEGLKTIVRKVSRTIEFGDKDNLQHQCSRGIDIKFKNLIYRARQNIFRAQCKLKKKINIQ